MKNAMYAQVTLIIIYLLLLVLPAGAEIDKASIFKEARRPASDLDLQLYIIENAWRDRFLHYPDETIKRRWPLISKTRFLVELKYYNDDRISVAGFITNLDEFLRLSKKERKQLLLNVVEHIRDSLSIAHLTLVDKKTGKDLSSAIENHQIRLSVIITSLNKNDNGEKINFLILPFGTGIGVAGYKDGQFVFSKDYFLELKVRNGVALSGDPKNFIIEQE